MRALQPRARVVLRPPIDKAPTVPGQTLVIANTKSDSTESFEVAEVEDLLDVGGSNVTLAVGASITLVGDPYSGEWTIQ